MGLEQTRLKHRGWEDYWRSRSDANQALNVAMVALRLSSAAVSGLPSGAHGMTVRDPYRNEIADVRHVGMRVDRAPEHFRRAEQSLAEMAVPYAVSTYNEYVLEAVKLLVYNGTSTLSSPESKMLGTLERELERCGFRFDGEQKRLHEAIKEIRNVVIHRGTRADKRFLDARDRLRTEDLVSWADATDSDFPTAEQGSKLKLEVAHARGAFWVTGNLATEVNVFLQDALDRELWADLLVSDLRARNPGAWTRGDPDNQLRRVCKFASQTYGRLRLQPAELAAATLRAPKRETLPDKWPRP